MSAWIKLCGLIGLIAASVAGGYLMRRAGAGEKLARRLSYFVLTVPYAIVGFLAIWGLKIQPVYGALPAFGLIGMIAGTLGGMVIARAMKLSRPMAGAFVLVAGASNLGFTMGGFVNYALFGELGLGIAAIYTMFWDFGTALVLYPAARHYGSSHGQSLGRLILANFTDIRCLPLLTTIIGLALNLSGVPRPAMVDRLHLIRIGIIGGSVVAFLTTGLRLHVGQLGLHRRQYVAAGLIKFVLMPAVGAALLGVLMLAGHPLSSPAWKVVLVQASTPAAIYSVIISNLFDLDDRLASLVFVVNTASYLVLILPIIVLLLG